METQSSLLCSKEHATDPCPETYESSRHRETSALMIHFKDNSHLCLSLICVVILLDFTIEILYFLRIHFVLNY
jgi:hypothetical protein